MKDVSRHLMNAILWSHGYLQQRVSDLNFKMKINYVAIVPVNLQKVCSAEAY